ncbi:MAG: hypothetical protein ACHQHN_12520 [Sphingobacteriales bacterium]
MKPHIKVLPIVLVVILLAACKKDDKPTMIDVTLSTGNQVSPNGLNVYLLSDDHRTMADNVSSGKADANGKINFTVTPGKVYYIYNGHFGLTNADATYIITGKFTTQQQIDGSPAQTPAAQIGDNIEMDINGDGVINAIDQVIKVAAPAKGSTSQVSVTVNIPVP